MADSEEWLVGEDGCLSVGQPTDSVTYHSTLNTILVVTKEPAVKVLDATSGSVLQSSNVSAHGSDGVRCAFLASKERVLLCDSHSVGLRRDLNGVLLLDTALQTPVSKADDVVTVELPLPEAKHLFKCIMGAELTGVAYVEEVLRKLETGVEAAQLATKANHKVAKWATVCLRLPHCKLLSVCSSLVTELKRLHQHVPGLSVASAIIDRLMYLLPGCSVFETMPSSAGQFDRALMYSEAARRETFSKWPHMNYKWALPDQMSQAGFYHQPSSTGDDRAMCFTCNVCLVCWEPTDEPWSEHERHSPQCPFVKGEYTQNVPMCVTYATEPAHLHGSSTDKIECVSTTSSDDYFATSTLHGNVVVWNMSRQLQQHIQFNIDPCEPIIAMVTGTQLARYDDIPLKLPSTSTADDDEAGDTGAIMRQESGSEVASVVGSSDTVCQGIAEVIEVSGAWVKPMKVTSEVMKIPLQLSQPQEMFPQRQPSPDVLVSALCVLDGPDEGAIGATPLTIVASSGRPSPCLVSGVTIRRSAMTNYQVSPVVSDDAHSKEEVLNQVNQALNEGTLPEIISPGSSTNDMPSAPPSDSGNPFVPYLLVHDITGSRSVSRKSSSKDCGGNGKDAAPMPAGYHKTGGALYQAIQQAYPQYMLDVEDEPDVQIIGVTPPLLASSDPDSSTSSAETSLPLTDLGNPPPPPNVSLMPPGGSTEAMSKPDFADGGTRYAGMDGGLTQWSGGGGKPGHVVQCIELPRDHVTSAHYVSAIVPTLDGRHVVVAVSPKCVNAKINVISRHGMAGNTSSDATESTAPPGGCVLLFRVVSEGSVVHLDDSPVRMCTVDTLDDAVKTVVMLPPEIVQTSEDDSDDDDRALTISDDDTVAGCGYARGQFAVTTHRGDVKILDLCDFKTIARIVPPDDRVFVSTTYCIGIDRLCCCTSEGQLHFYAIGPAKLHRQDSELDLHCSPLRPDTAGLSSRDDADVTAAEQVAQTDDLLVQRPLTAEVLATLVELTRFENLVPRYSATVPPCWSEMQQEQQQRRHPQHLHRHGEATQHTRTWRLQQDSSSWDEHLFELVLPRPCCVSHIDLKFSLHPLCITPPSLQITLLKQSSSTIGHATFSETAAQTAAPPVEVDVGIDFKVDPQQHVANCALTREFLERHSAEVVCGPVELANFVDLSGRGGLVTLTSPKLLRIKTKSFLLHVKALPCERPPSPLQRDNAAKTDKKAKPGGSNASNGEKSKGMNIKKLMDQLPFSPAEGATSGGESNGASVGKQKLESVRGCDWMQEISVTVRKNTKTNIPRDRLQRCLMVDDQSFHRRLVALVCRRNDGVACSTSEEHRQKLAIDLLMWIVTIQMNDIRKDDQPGGPDQHCVVSTIQESLKPMVRACFLRAGRTVAHRCAKLITLCIEFNKNATDPDTVPGFKFALLDALVDSLSLVPGAYSAGALFWYFTLLNRVKRMDANLTAQICTDILCHVAQQYNDKTNHWHSLLKARFGLYGCPLEPDLFDVDPPLHVKASSSGTVSYAGAVSGGSGSGGTDEIDFQDLFSMTSSGGSEKLSGSCKTDQISRHISGLLEVEPLHYTCHATSDGTRIERLDTGSGISVVGQPTGTINFGDSVPTTAGAALASLSTAMASAEHQLHMLQQKQVQLLKLQQQKQKLEQKLAETSKSSVPTGTGSVCLVGTANMGGATSNFVPYSSELLPPTPKNTPFFMTPPVTPPNESYAQYYQNSAAMHVDLGKPPTGKGGVTAEGVGGKDSGPPRLAMVFPQTQCLFHPAPAQVLVIERMHSGARRFVVLDFGKPVMLTDLVIPACNDLASLCIDSWVQSEEVDGQRLVVTTDIGYRSLVLNDLAPPPICRYLKITTIGRYGGSTTRTRIPIGTFYGHTFVLPWEWSSRGQASAVASHPLSTATAANDDPVATTTAAASLADHTQIMTQLNMFVSLQEDIQCRYSLACDRLVELLGAVDTPQHHNGHTQYYLRRGTKKTDDDARITRAYHACMLLQLQLNLAQKAIERLQTALGISVGSEGSTTGSMTALLKRCSVDKLRVLTELLLDVLLSMTHSTPSIPHTPVSLYNVLGPHVSEVLFRNLCVVGTRKMQIHAGVLLVRVCGGHAWWGEFLGRMLQDLFVSEQALAFPRDRVFVLLTALGQKSLTGQSASEVIESILMLLGKLLSPLLAASQQPRDVYYRSASMQLDLPLIGWLLLFLSKNLDVTISAVTSEEADRGRDNGGSRWDFIQGEAALANSRMSSAMRTTSAKLYRRKLQKRLMHHEHQLFALQQAKKSFTSAPQGGASSSTEKGGAACPDVETAINAHQEQLFNKKLKLYSSKHFKDLINIRRTEGEILRKLPAKDSGGSSSSSEKSHSEDELETNISVSRDKCLPVVHGLISLLLSMDFTCNVDLFVIACKVAARITNLTRPAICLSEVMTTDQLERLVLLSCDLNYNHGNITWGGSWAGHVITCLLQDILDGEKLYPASSEGGLTDDEVGANSASETDESMTHIALSTIDEDSSVTSDAIESAAESPQSTETVVMKDNGNVAMKFDKESIVNMILEDEIYGDLNHPKLQEYLSMEPGYAGFKSGETSGSNASYVFQYPMNALAMQTMSSEGGAVTWGPPKGFLKKGTFDTWKNKIANFASGKGPPMPLGVSTAMDARLENGVQLIADLRLKVMLSMESEIVQTVIGAPLPVPLPGVVQQSYRHQGYHQVATDDEQLSQANFLSSISQNEVVPSSSMLSTCFDHLFGQLGAPQQRRVNMETLLSTWLMLNDNVAQTENGAPLFDASRVPSISLSEASVAALLAALAWQPVVPVRLWVLALQTLTLLANVKCVSEGDTMGGERWLARAILADGNLSAVLVNFLSVGSVQGSGGSHYSAQVGPTATRALQEFLLRLQLRCCAEGRENDLKELLLKLVYTLTAERGAFYSSVGPLDAQCRLLDFMLEQIFESVDVNNALSVIESIAFLVYRHIVSQERLVCHNVVEPSTSAPTCFSGLFSSMLRPVAGDAGKSSGAEVNRDQLMSSLLKLVNVLVQMPVRTMAPPGGIVTDFPHDFDPANLDVDNPMTDSGKMATAAVLHQRDDRRDDAVASATDEQKTETAANAAGGGTPGDAAAAPPRPCSHFVDSNVPDAEQKPPMLVNVILAHRQIMAHLIEGLSCCNSNTMAMILGSSGLKGSMHDLFTGTEPLSVGDGIFHVLCTINRTTSDVRLVLKAVYNYLTCGGRRPLAALSGGGGCISQLSEPLLWFLLQVLDCKSSIEIFLEMGGVETVCYNLVHSNRRLISTVPSLVSTMMQHLSSARTPSGGSAANRGKAGSEADNTDGMQNFAPLGTITSSSPTSGPADVLIQALPPHRRARSAAWSYHFYPEEAWIDLTISLPCAVLLMEVQIQPHLTSLATCPSSVSVEISRDNSTTIPLSSPVQTSGLTCIKIHLLKSEVVTAVTLRLHRPRDSNTIGLSQIMLFGLTAFSDTSLMRSNSIFVPTVDYVSRTSIGWLRLLHHCLTQCEEMESLVATVAAPIPDLLVTCTALLVSPSSIIYFTNIEAVLLRIGLHSTDIGLALIDSLLRNVGAPGENSGWAPLHSNVNGIANESTIDILYQLGMTVDDGTHVRVKAMTEWLGDNARVALQKSHGVTDEGYRLLQRHAVPPDHPAAAPAHVHCIAAMLWQSWQQTVHYDLHGIITQDLLSSVYEWSMVLSPGSTLKKAVDALICSLCYIRPEYFSLVLEWMGIVVSLDLSTAAVTDDNKDHQQGALTDDSKAEADSEARHAWAVWNDGSPAYQPTGVQDFGHMILDDLHLSTLAIACQSPDALTQLLGSGFVAVLCQGLFEFCTREMLRCSTDSLGAYMDGFTDASKSCGVGGTGRRSPRSCHSCPLVDAGGARPRCGSESSQSDKALCITADLVAPVLKFLAEVSKELAMKDWLGSPEGSIFWPVLLSLMCVTQTIVPSGDGPSTSKQMKVMTPQQWAAIELQTVEFFRQVICCHTDNQQLFATVLCDVIRTNSSFSRGGGYSTSPLSGFMRRLFLRVLLQDEKVLVSFRSTSELYKGQSNAMSAVIPHPCHGTGHKRRAVLVSLQSTCAEILAKVTDTPSLSAQSPGDGTGDGSWEKKAAAATGGSTEDAKKDIGELGLEMIDQFSLAAGLHAKEKRDKTSKGLLPRPPTRRGQRPPDPTVTSVNNIPVLALFHQLMPSQPLPGELTLSQLLVLLHDRGFSPGQASIELTINVKTKKGGATGLVTEETVPYPTLLNTPPFQSALHVFASVGGLALLAEHLPLLYPEITRQVTPPEVTREVGSSSTGIGHDWVTLEANEDMYEDVYEPVLIPPTQAAQPASQTTAATLPSVPPHSLVAFSLFLRLPGYAEVLLKERRHAQCLLRLVLGVTDDGEGGHILTSPVAGALPTLPFTILKTLFDTTPLTTDDGVLLRRMTLEIGAVHLILACLSVLSHHGPRMPIPGFHQEIILAATQAAASLAYTSQNSTAGGSGAASSAGKTIEDKGQNYWAKGTGFGTGSTTSSWDALQALLRQRSEEEHVTCLLQVLASYINPASQLVESFEAAAYDEEGETSHDAGLPPSLPELLSQSCLVPAISSYLRNDSVLDMARHVPLYKSLLELLRGLTVCPVLIPLLLPLDRDKDPSSSSSSSSSISTLLQKMKGCVDTYASRLKSNKVKSKSKLDDDGSEGLAELIPDIQKTAQIVDSAVGRLSDKSAERTGESDLVDSVTALSHRVATHDDSSDQLYVATIKELQFDAFEMVQEDESGLKFLVPHHYESNVKAAGDMTNASRARRLAQEAVTLSTSLPLSASSSVFVRCDEERLDVMKVLITGPSDTPYMNGCFEFDVYFPLDYPNAPPLISLETTGNHTVRFNPNLYNDGKVCLSVLNTWHGRPEEKWNSQTSSFLQVLVSIQSLILVSEPYFNEPGYERSRGTPSGTASCREYDANIRQAAVKWGMLEPLKNPSVCFKEVIENHFRLKRKETMTQIEGWISEMEAYSGDKRSGRSISHSCMALKRHYAQLKDELAKMKPAEGETDSTTEVTSTEAFNWAASSTKSEAPGIGTVPPVPAINHLSETSASNDDTATSGETLPPYLLSNHLSNGSDDAGFDECDTLGVTTVDIVQNAISAGVLATNTNGAAPLVVVANSAAPCADTSHATNGAPLVVVANSAGTSDATNGAPLVVVSTSADTSDVGLNSKVVTGESSQGSGELTGVSLAEVVSQGGHS